MLIKYFFTNKNIFIKVFLSLISVIAFLFSQAVLAQESKNVRVNLISEFKKVPVEKLFYVAIEMKHNQGWHTYWKNPGEAGIPTSVKWKNSDIQYGEINWPTPKRFNYENTTTYGLTGNELLIIPVKIAKSFSRNSVNLDGEVSWLECNDVCIPSKKQISIELPIDKRPEIDESVSAEFSDARNKLATYKNNKNIKVSLSEENLVLEIPKHKEIDTSYFFPYDENIVETNSTQNFEKTKNHYELTIGKLNSTFNVAEGILLIDYVDGSQDKLFLNNKIKKSDTCLDRIFN